MGLVQALMRMSGTEVYLTLFGKIYPRALFHPFRLPSVSVHITVTLLLSSGPLHFLPRPRISSIYGSLDSTVGVNSRPDVIYFTLC